MGLFDRVKKALELQPGISVPVNELQGVEGFSVAYFETIGLSKGDLRKLESKGLAIRGYTKNLWVAGETLPNGKEVRPGESYRGKGHHPRWVLVADARE